MTSRNSEPLGYDRDSIPLNIGGTGRIKRAVIDKSQPLGCDSEPRALFFKPPTPRPTPTKEPDPMQRRLAADASDYMDDATIQKILQFCRQRGIAPDDVKELELMLYNPGGEVDRNNTREMQRAEAESRGVLTAEDCLACDSADGIRRLALRRMGVGTAGMNGAALSAVLQATKQARRSAGRPMIEVAMDAAAMRSFEERFPNAARINTASARVW